MKGLHSLKAAVGSRQTKKRLGRGNGSGIGSYSGKGIKGQKARSGNKGLTARSMRPYLLRIPKVRGFNANTEAYAIVNISDLQKHFNDGESVTPKTLRVKGILTGTASHVKILSTGSLQKKLQVSAHAFSKGAREAIEKAGGTVTVFAPLVKIEPRKEKQVKAST